MRRTFILLWLLGVFFSISAQAAEPNPFPHRDKYPSVKVMEVGQLHDQRENLLVVDVRSGYEYDTLHIKGAINVPLNRDSFVQDVSNLARKDGQKIVFYCNGGTCKKSYQAVMKAKKAGIDNCIAYDAGIYAWAKRYPSVSVLLGESPMQQGAFIDNEKFKSRLLTAEQFESRMGAKAIVLDIRDRIQRDSMLFPFNERRAELDDIDNIANIVAEAKRKKKALLIYDKVGKQARWFQYYLEKQGVKNYYFMDGGSEQYYETKLGKFRLQPPGDS